MPAKPHEYIAVEIWTVPAGGFTLGTDRLGSGRLAEAATWLDVTCNLQHASFRRGGKESPLSSAIDAGYLSITSRNDLNPLDNVRIHPGVPIRVRDTRASVLNGTLFIGALDDAIIRYDKYSGDYFVTLTASDLVRNMRSLTVRGDLDQNPQSYDSREAVWRIQEMLQRANLPFNTGFLVSKGWSRQSSATLSPSSWSRFGAAPAGVNERPLEVSEDTLMVFDNPSAADLDIDASARERGVSALLTGLAPGRLTRVTLVISQAASLATRDDDQNRYVLFADTGASSNPTPTTVGGSPQRVRLELVFRPTATQHRVYVARDFTGIVSTDTDARIFEAYYLRSFDVTEWSALDYSSRPIQRVAYESSVYNQLTMAADSVDYRWHVDTTGRVYVRPARDVVFVPQAHFTDWKRDPPARNYYQNPSFEAVAPLPAGATRSNDWSARGDWSLYIPPLKPPGYGQGPYGQGPYGNGPREEY